MLNKRQKVILFITLVITGTALLAGARLTESVGMLMLGAALAWLIGSETAFRTYDHLRKLPGKVWPWLRLLLAAVFAGCVLVAVGVWSQFNSFLVVGALTVVGVIISPFRQLPIQRRWFNALVWIAAAVVFFLTVVGASQLSGTAPKSAERFGELAAYGLIALPIGMWWLVKGWKVIIAGISAEPATVEPQGEVVEPKTGATLLYILLIAGVLVLTLCLSVLAFSAFSDSIFPSKHEVLPATNSPLTPVASWMLLAWWPYACWKGILRREPNNIPANLKRHKRMAAAVGVVSTVLLSVAVTFGIQNGNDSKLTAEIEDNKKNFLDSANKIGAIKRRDFQTTKDYIDAYEELEPLLAEFDDKFRHLESIIDEGAKRDSLRGPLNVQRLGWRSHQAWMLWDVEIFALLRQDIELTKKQVALVKDMAALPEAYQVKFWQKNFQPLAEEEEALRQKIASAQARKPAK